MSFSAIKRSKGIYNTCFYILRSAFFFPSHRVNYIRFYSQQQEPDRSHPRPSDHVNFAKMDTVEQEDGLKYVVLSEGRASVLFENENQVFYNPVQQFNRDLSTLAIRAWSQEFMEMRAAKKKKKNNNRKAKNKSKKEEHGDQTLPEVATLTNTREESKVDGIAIEEGNKAENKKVEPFITILEALSATGLRAIRYALEIPNLKTVVANDFSPAAVDAIRRNVKYNSGAETIVEPSHGDANLVMYSRKANPFHCIDLDPYGTAAPFVDAAVQAIADDGLLLVTCTDLGVLAGQGYPEKCFSNYGGMTSKTEFCHESALRLVLNLVATTAARYGKAIEPLLSLSIDFYVRLFIKVKHSPIQVKSLARYPHVFFVFFIFFSVQIVD